jgi:hypothetical protein
MPKFLIAASYTAEGLEGLRKDTRAGARLRSRRHWKASGAGSMRCIMRWATTTRC